MIYDEKISKEADADLRGIYCLSITISRDIEKQLREHTSIQFEFIK